MRHLLLITLSLISFFVSLAAYQQNNNVKPVVIWHGMGDSCCNPLSMGYIKKLLVAQFPGIYVHSLKFGKNIAEDMELSFFGNMNEIVDEACEKIKNDANLQNGFNALGFSQGGLFLRALVQSCPEAKVYNLISFGGPQQGIYGIPYCRSDTGLCNSVRHLLNHGAYSRIVQSISIQAQYWHDPIVAEGYAHKNIFLADINCANVKSCNPQYKKNLLKINNLVLVKFLRDEMVIPKESEWFGYYADNSTTEIVSFEETELYKKDLIGLKTLHQQHRLRFIEVNGQHLRLPKEQLHEIFNSYLAPSPFESKQELIEE